VQHLLQLSDAGEARACGQRPGSGSCKVLGVQHPPCSGAQTPGGSTLGLADMCRASQHLQIPKFLHF